VSNRSGCHDPLDLVIGVRRSVHRLGKPAALAHCAVVRDVVGAPVQYVDDSRVMFSPTSEDTHDQMLGRDRLADQQSESARHVPASLVGRSRPEIYDLLIPDASHLARRVEGESAARVCGTDDMDC
jgi:hypothetical protein